MNTVAPARGRAAPLPPDERRAAILLAVQPVLLERGAAATTRELAEAAGVAEGTLFRVFTDKNTLVRQAVMAAVDPAAGVPEIKAVDMSLPLRDRLVVLMQLGLDRVENIMRWMQVLHEVARADDVQPKDRLERMRAWQRSQEPGTEALREAVHAVLSPDADRLRLPVAEVDDLMVTVLLGAIMRTADAHRRGLEPEPPDAARLVDLILHGVARPDATDIPERTS